MNKYIKIILWIAGVAIASTILYYFLVVDKNKKIPTLRETQKKEAVSCTATTASRCFRYRCNSGYINYLPIPMPGTSGMVCSDGSRIEELEEVVK